MNKACKQSSSSPSQTETLPPPLMTFLRSNYGSRISKRKSRMTPLFSRRRRLIEAQAEPSSPKVTCIGQVKSKKAPPPRRRIRLSKSRGCCRWIRGVLLCSKLDRKPRWRGMRLPPLLRIWAWVLKFVSCGKNQSHKESAIDSPGEGGRRAEGVQCEICPVVDRTSPPRNAFLLTRCRSASSVGMRFRSKAETEDDKGVHVGDDNSCSTSGVEPMRRDSTAESRRDPESLNNRGSAESDTTSSTTRRRRRSSRLVVVRLQRCKSDPGRIGQRWVSDPELELGRRKSGF